MTPGPCTRPTGHRFDPTSGWCTNGCGWRSDGHSAYHPHTRPPLAYVDITQPRHPKETP